MIRCENISKTYNIGKSNSFSALSDINLEIKKGEFITILGKSGSGKSTLMNIIGLIDTMSTGKLFINNIDIFKQNDNAKADFRNQNIGYIFQSFYLDTNYSVYKNIEMPLLIQGVPKKQRKEKILKVLSQLNIEGKIKNSVKNLSGGEQQRVCIARAIVTQPQILLCDEPCGNLDTENSKIVLDFLKEENKLGKTVILITHNADEAEFATRKIFLKDGRVVDEKQM